MKRSTIRLSKKGTIYTPRFALICLSSLFFSASYNMLIPELPAYLSQMGGAPYIGLIIALFTLTAGISRPFSGKLTDTIGRKPVMIFGALVCLISGFLYPILTSVSGFLILRLFHGFSTGFNPTATATYVADIVPKERWGEALGIQGISFSTGLALGPALGSLIKLHFSFDVLFYSSSIIALISLLFIANLKETLVQKQRFERKLLKISKTDIIAPEVLPAAIVTFLTYVAFGVILTLIPDWSQHVGFVNKGTFFIVFTIASLLVRFVAGKMSDQYGRIRVIHVGLVLLVVSLFLIGYRDTTRGLLTGAALYGLAMGIISPAVNAWTIDMSHPRYRGKAMATMYIALESGIGLGALFSGWYYRETLAHVPHVLYACGVLALLALLYMGWRHYKKVDRTTGL
ncbi:MFS transporter [Spongiimicrobium sp. 2-473A-2-J]|uniref:MFS transporter n=1 Tax=Eudoraea algarum TaxID=3417568 RepID=UPI003D361665